jgi:dihydroneopterin triphosphate aldolase (PTPS-III) / 6-pyruvoyltetrahydropterin synthase
MSDTRYEVFVSKDSFKFNAAHFMAYPGFRERLHGHNYRVSVRVEGRLNSDGYVIDFGDIKRAANDICHAMNERTIVPMNSDCLKIERSGGDVRVTCEDGSSFSFPEADCVLLPIAHSSAEELADYVCARLLDALPGMRVRGVTAVEVAVAEAPAQEARCRRQL